MPPKQIAATKKPDGSAKKAPPATSKGNTQRKSPVVAGPNKPGRNAKMAPPAMPKGSGRKSPVEASMNKSTDSTTAADKVTSLGKGDALSPTTSKASSIVVNKPSLEATPIVSNGADSAEQNVESKPPDGVGLNQDALMQALVELQEHIQVDKSKQMAPDYLDALKGKVNKLTSDMDQLKNYCDTSQKQLETFMGPIKQITDKIFRTIAVPEATDEGHKKTLEELELELRQKHLHVQLAKVDDELLRISKIAIETEAAAVEASRACAEAVEVAKQIQEELEEKRRQEQELLKQKEAEKRIQEEKRLEEERKRIEEEKKEAALIKLREKEARQWPLINITIESALDFDGGIGCIIRADPQYFKKSNVNCTVVDLQDAGFVYPDNEEVISNVIELSPTSTTFQLKCNLCVFIPHNLSRQQAASREPAIKVETAPGRWTEIPTKDTALDKFRELKFVQGDVRVFCKLIVVSRFKKDHLKLKKRGGRFVSNVDPRVTFTTTPETFTRNEKLAVQMHPVDQFSMAELKRTMPEAKGLLTSSSVFSIEWESRTFATPIVMTLPVPPNPVVVKKAAMARAAKDSRGRPAAAGGDEGAQDPETGGEAKDEGTKRDDIKALTQRSKGTEVKKGTDTKKPQDAKKATDAKKAPEEGKKKPKDGTGKGKEGETDADADDPSGGLSTKPIKWYMGQYATNTDDERDQFFILQMNEKRKRWVVEEIQIDPVKIDMIEMKLSAPIDRFVVFRTSLNLTSKEAERIADTLQTILVHRTVQLLVRQKMEDACDVMVYAAPITRLDRITRKLQDDDYDVGPEPSKEFNLKDGDLLELAFRGNVRCISQTENPKNIFNTNLDTKFQLTIQERDIYVQKSYDVYRGFIQLRKVTKVVTMPVRKKVNTAMAAVQRTTDNENSEEGNVDGSLAQVQEAPLKPIVEFKPVLLTEVLITFPKNLDLLAPKPLRKAPITYLPINDPIGIHVLTKIAKDLGPEWVALASTLGVKPVNLMILQRDAMLQKRSMFDQKFEMLLLWVKTLEKSENKTAMLASALEAHGRDDLLRHLEGHS